MTRSHRQALSETVSHVSENSAVFGNGGIVSTTAAAPPAMLNASNRAPIAGGVSSPAVFTRWRQQYGIPMVVAASIHAAAVFWPASKNKDSLASRPAKVQAPPTLEIQAIASIDAMSSSSASAASAEPVPALPALPPLEEKPSFTLPLRANAPSMEISVGGAGTATSAFSADPAALGVDFSAAQFGGISNSFAQDGRSLATLTPEPPYPERARQESRQGVVELKVVINPDGTPHHVEIVRSSSSSDLDSAARNAVLRLWRFRRDSEFRVCTVRIAFELARSSL